MTLLYFDGDARCYVHGQLPQLYMCDRHVATRHQQTAAIKKQQLQCVLLQAKLVDFQRSMKSRVELCMQPTLTTTRVHHGHRAARAKAEQQHQAIECSAAKSFGHFLWALPFPLRVKSTPSQSVSDANLLPSES